jgi:DNA-binding beta-propeller fold protein YncE
VFFRTTLYFLVSMATMANATTLKRVSEIDLPGPPGKRFDYLKIDEKNHRLFSAHLGANLLYVIDLKTSKLINTIVDTPGAEGVEYVAEFDKVYTSNWSLLQPSIGVVDLKKMKVVKKIPALAKPDGSAYAEPFHKLYVSDERANAVIVVDVLTDTIVKTLKFESETGMPQFDPVTRKIYVNLQDTNKLAVLDPRTDTVEDMFSVDPCKGNHGMVLDAAHRLAFLGCEGNDQLAVFDLAKHQIVTTISLAGGVDVIAFDPILKRIYAACSTGSISVIQKEDGTHFTKLEDFKVQRKVHSLPVDPETHKVYAPEELEDGKPVSRMIIYDAVFEKTKN